MEPNLTGILNLDKPPGISSARAVGRVKRLIPRGTKIGHAGTLDPFATGVLLLLIGKATKWCERLMDAPKQYEGMIKLGASTPTDDLESEETTFPDVVPASRSAVEVALRGFVGEIQQRPPAYSAMKIQGRRAYDLARKGNAVELEPRLVKIYAIELLAYAWPLAKVRIDCGRGTYIRAIARDLGMALGSGGYLTQLRRTRIGPFDQRDSAKLDQLSASDLQRYLQGFPSEIEIPTVLSH